jgi:hypothetical protein
MLVVEPLAAAMAGVADACGKRGGGRERERERERGKEKLKGYILPPCLPSYLASFSKLTPFPSFPFSLPAFVPLLASFLQSNRNEHQCHYLQYFINRGRELFDDFAGATDLKREDMAWGIGG